MTTTIRTALVTTLVALLYIAALPAIAHADYRHPATYDEVMRVEGQWRLGFLTHNDDGTRWLLPSVPDMLRAECGRGSDEARACRVEWRAFYRGLVDIRNADPSGPDYWPFPSPEPTA